MRGTATERAAKNFLAEMEQVAPWQELLALIEPHNPKAGRGRRSIGALFRPCLKPPDRGSDV